MFSHERGSGARCTATKPWSFADDDGRQRRGRDRGTAGLGCSFKGCGKKAQEGRDTRLAGLNVRGIPSHSTASVADDVVGLQGRVRLVPVHH